VPPLVLTRPSAQAGHWIEALQGLGVPAVSWPLIEIGPAPDPAALAQAWAQLPGTDLAFFASPNAVAAVMAAQPPGRTWPAHTWAATVGPGSAKALLAAGVPRARLLTPDADAAQFDSEALWPFIAQQGPWLGRQALLLRGQGGREWLGERLAQAGAQVQALAVYSRGAPHPTADELAQLRALMEPQARALWLLSSSEAVGHWVQLHGSPLPPLHALATHPRIAQAAAEAGLQVRWVPPDPPAVAAAWQQHCAS
jgi:uroporphyrinogen-III synthase